MSVADMPLFAAFVLSDEGRSFFRWEFDERVGPSTDPGPAYSQAVRKSAIALSRVRIDAVGWDGAGPVVFEVKPEARLGALGQIVAYRYFWCKDRGPGCRAAIITDSDTPYSKEIFAEMEVTLHIVRPASPQDLLEAIRLTCGHCILQYDDIRYIYEDLA